ncbi:MAG: 3-deoxy-7-phosphoheptulonate synthase, partial [Terriglobia bacterium]
MQEGATEEQIHEVMSRLMQIGFDIHRSTGVLQTVLG